MMIALKKAVIWEKSQGLLWSERVINGLINSLKSSYFENKLSKMTFSFKTNQFFVAVVVTNELYLHLTKAASRWLMPEGTVPPSVSSAT